MIETTIVNVVTFPIVFFFYIRAIKKGEIALTPLSKTLISVGTLVWIRLIFLLVEEL